MTNCFMPSTHTAAFTYLRLARFGCGAGQGLLVFMPEIIFIDAMDYEVPGEKLFSLPLARNIEFWVNIDHLEGFAPVPVFFCHCCQQGCQPPVAAGQQRLSVGPAGDIGMYPHVGHRTQASS